jgi:long-chain acyl-CoA synthetase
MKGYLGDAGGTGIDRDGWFSTGDVGYEDAEGWLFLVDRIKDVFKCDNWLVSPTELERVVSAHPAIREVAVVGLPDEFRGAVPFAFLVLADPGASRDVAAEALEVLNCDLADYQRITHFEVVKAIPRGPTGKVSRSELRMVATQNHKRSQEA